MQDPQREITSVVLQLVASDSPDVQKAAFERYVAPDVGFKHPLCYVPPSPNSRDTLLGIYQWYRVLSPKIVGKVHNVVYDKENNLLLLDFSQIFHVRLSPFKPAWSRLLVRINLAEGVDGLHYISYQEDFYHVEDFARLLVPCLAPVIQLTQAVTSVASNVLDGIAQTLGFWRPTTGPRRRSTPGHPRSGVDGGLYDGAKSD